MNEHEDNSSITEGSLWEKRESIGVIKEFITKSPVDSSSRWKCESEDIECGQQINVLEFLGFPHGMHYFPAKFSFY